MISTKVLLLSLLGGILPALLWLLFWLREDRKRPEPRRLIILAFIAGMAVVPLMLPLEQAIAVYASGSIAITIIGWAVIEETAKLVVAYFTVLRQKAVDEPIDPLIYLITISLGFAAAENSLFLITSFSSDSVVNTLITGNLRFIGASLLHTITGATIGIFMAFAFYKPRVKRYLYMIAGLLLAIILHSYFNLSIISDSNNNVFAIFSIVWLAIIIMMIFFEKIKTFKA